MVYVALIIMISPFGWIAGQLSAIDRSLPFVLNMCLFGIGIGLVLFIGRPGFLNLEKPAGIRKAPEEIPDMHAA
jgi:hypothetical protein